MNQYSILPDVDLFDIAKSDIKNVFDIYKSSPNGISANDAKSRLKIFGKNTLKEIKEIHILIEFLSTFRNPLVIILACISLISFFIGETINASLILLMIFLSVTLNFLQEYKASKSAGKLKSKVAAHASVIRDQIQKDILSCDVAIGDILELNAGDLIPADARVIEANDLFVNQASLTGESFPVEKFSHTVDTQKANLIDLSNILFAGTSVTTGKAKALVVKTGVSTQFGQLAKTISEQPEENEFTRGIGEFSNLILRVIIIFVIVIFTINVFLKQDLLQSLMFSIAVAVGLTPEFLPMIMSVTMGKGSISMAKKGVIVKRLTAIPTFGSMDVLCTDKTGTLTEAKIHLIKYIDIYGKNSPQILENAYLNSYYQTGISNPMDDAVLLYKKIDISDFGKIDEIPFDFVRKKLSVVVSDKQGVRLITKGAPEEILKSCNSISINHKHKQIHQAEIDQYQKMYQELSSQGFRVLAVAVKKISNAKHSFSKHDEIEMELLGFTAFLDPARLGAKLSIAHLKTLGVEIKVVTGDNELVTQKICADLDIKVKGIVLGHDVDVLTDEALKHIVENNTIFARFSPQQKSRIIRALKSNGHVVGYIGDGINDASSLNTADVGISVANAVDVAKESADIILTNKSLSELTNGVIEGRKTFGNTLKYILMGLSSNFGNMFSVLGAVIFLPFLPMLPLQILLNNFLYDFSQLTIPSDNVDENYIKKPKRWNIKYIRNFMYVFGPISSFYDFMTFGVMYYLYHNFPSSFQTGWFMESLATQTLVIHVIRTRLTPITKSVASLWLWITTITGVSIGWIIPYSPIGKYFGFTPLPINVVAVLILIVIVYLVMVEAGKRIFYRHLSYQDR
jgi:P-type Mg2+ transporter